MYSFGPMDPSEFNYEFLESAQTQRPASIYGFGRNYLKHIEELKNELPTEPVVFLKSLASLRPLRPATIPQSEEHTLGSFDVLYDEGTHFEAEITVLMGQKIPLGAKVTAKDILGLGLGLDLTRRGVQEKLKSKGLPWARAKSFGGSAVVTPFFPMSPDIDLKKLQFEMRLNGVTKQKGDSGLMMFPILTLLENLAMFTPLFPGDLIFTGTPEGVGPINKGDTFALTWTYPIHHSFSAVF